MIFEKFCLSFIRIKFLTKVAKKSERLEYSVMLPISQCDDLPKHIEFLLILPVVVAFYFSVWFRTYIGHDKLINQWVAKICVSHLTLPKHISNIDKGSDSKKINSYFKLNRNKSLDTSQRKI